MNKKLIFISFALLLVLVPFYIIFNSESILENGHQHKLRLEGYDPFDPFRGKYIRLNYDFDSPCEKGFKDGDEGFVVLEKDVTGFSHFSMVTKQQPKHSDYIKCKVNYVFDDKCVIAIENIGKYFINENKAVDAEKLLTNIAENDVDKTYATIRVLDGECRLEEVYVKDKPLKTFFEK